MIGRPPPLLPIGREPGSFPVAGPGCRHVKLNGSLWETLGRAEENIHNNSISVEMRRKDPGWSPLRAAGLN